MGTADLRPWYDFVTCTREPAPIGEVWLTGDECKVQTGVLAGKTLGESLCSNIRRRCWVRRTGVDQQGLAAA
jgi:hypothetical protein